MTRGRRPWWPTDRAAPVEPSSISRPVTGLAVDTTSGPDDIVYVGWQTYPPTGPRLAKIAVSTDGGRTFSQPRTPYDEETSKLLGGSPGLEGLPPQMQGGRRRHAVRAVPGPHDRRRSHPASCWLPRRTSGTLHAVFEDRQARPLGPRDIFYVRSTDGGAFSPPRLINDDDPQKRFTHVNPNMSVAPNGRVDLVWWDFRDGAGPYATDVYYAYSYDNGQSWSRNFRVTERSINRKVGTWSNNFDYRAPPSVASSWRRRSLAGTTPRWPTTSPTPRTSCSRPSS